MLPSVSSHMNVPAPPLYGFTGTAAQLPGVPGTGGGLDVPGFGLVDGLVEGLVDADGPVVRDGVGEAGGEAGREGVPAGEEPGPVHFTPLRVKLVGDGLDEPFQDPLNPN